MAASSAIPTSPSRKSAETEKAFAASRAGSSTLIQRYFEVSLYLLVATAVLTLVFTRKLDLLTDIAATMALGYKGLRIWRGRPPEISHSTATALVLGYFLFFPIDLWIFRATSRKARRIRCSTRDCSRQFTCCSLPRWCGCIPRGRFATTFFSRCWRLRGCSRPRFSR